jgi:hypothetical protein
MQVRPVYTTQIVNEGTRWMRDVHHRRESPLY